MSLNATDYLGSARDDKPKLKDRVLLTGYQLASQLQRPPTCDDSGDGVVEKNTRLIDHLGVDRFFHDSHAIVAFVIIPKSQPAALSRGSNDIKVKGGKCHECCDMRPTEFRQN